MAASSNDTVSDGLKKLFTQVAQIKLLPDGQQHMGFLTMLEQGIMKYLQSIASGAAAMGGPGGGMAGGPPGGGPPPGMGGAPGGPPGSAAPAAQFAPGGGSGGGSVGLAPNINPDELNRVLAGAGGPQ